MKDNKEVSLFLNTATKALSIGAQVGEKSDTLTLDNPKQALETTHLGIKALGDSLGFALADVDAFYCLLGPGSNTGIRLGLTIPRTVYALNPKIRIYGIDTLKLYLHVEPTALSALSDRNGNLFVASYSEDGSYTFERVDKKDIDEKIPQGASVIIENEDRMAKDELSSRNLIFISVIEEMMKRKEAFDDYSSREEDYLPCYTQAI